MKKSNKNKIHRKRRIRRSPLWLMAAAAVLLSLFVLGSPKAKAQREDSEKYYTSIIVEEGESLWSIARTYAPAYSDLQAYIDELARMNALTPEGKLRKGQSLIISYYQ